MLFKTIILSVLLFVSVVSANKKQKNVRPNHDCTCRGYVAKATECNWPDKDCAKVAESSFKNYMYWCSKLNAFRSAKREGNTSATYNRTLTCQSNMSRAQRDAIYANEKSTGPSARYYRSLMRINIKSPFTIDPATNIDWTENFPPVKYQGGCGSCWAFAVVGYFEAYRAIKGLPVVALSEQHVINCDTSNGGCAGGFTPLALDFLFTVGTSLATDIPYTEARNAAACPATKPLFKMANQAYYEIYTATEIGTLGVTNPNGNCKRLRQLLNAGPVVSGIFVDDGFYQYRSGAYMSTTCPSDGRTNHAVIVVAYGPIPGTSPEINGFKVRNSWGASWGMAGYIWVADNENVCGLCSRLKYA